jgi:hypothetical protein
MCTKADIVFVNFSKAPSISIGCVMELAWAYTHRKHTVGVLPKDSVHRHAFVIEAFDIIFETEEEAIQYLIRLAKK